MVVVAFLQKKMSRYREEYLLIVRKAKKSLASLGIPSGQVDRMVSEIEKNYFLS